MRQMKEEAEQFRMWRKQKDKEIMQLKEQVGSGIIHKRQTVFDCWFELCTMLTLVCGLYKSTRFFLHLNGLTWIYEFSFLQGRKRQFAYQKLEIIHSKQQAVLKRKTEEVRDMLSSNFSPQKSPDWDSGDPVGHNLAFLPLTVCSLDFDSRYRLLLQIDGSKMRWINRKKQQKRGCNSNHRRTNRLTTLLQEWG